jgi:hypothetical protein
VNSKGDVIGMAFAIDPGRNRTAYALTASEIQPDLNAAGASAVSTGPCLVD